jgi:hypothetical protein
MESWMVLGCAVDAEKEVIKVLWSVGPGYKHVNIMAPVEREASA